MPPNAVYATRPQITLNGQPAPALDARLTEMVITHALNQPAHCRAVFGGGTALVGADVGAFGAALHVNVGQPSNRIFGGSVYAIGADFNESGPPTSVIVAEDRLRALDMSQHSRVFTSAKDRDAINTVAAEAGLETQFEIESVEIVHDAMVQGNQTDLEFIRALAGRLGADIWCEDTRLIVRSRSAWDTSSALTLTYGAGLLRFSVLADLTTQASALEVTGWSVAHKSDIIQTAEMNGAALTLNDGQTGGELLAERLGEQTARVVHTAPASDEEALARAQARVEALAWDFVRGTGTALDKPELGIGKIVTLEGLGERFDGLYHCVAVRHRFDQAAGYRIEFEVERADFDDEEHRQPPAKRPGLQRPPIDKPKRGK